MTILIFVAIGLVAGLIILETAKLFKTPGRGSWILSAICSLTIYFTSQMLFLFMLSHFGLSALEVKVNPFGLQSVALNLFMFGVSSFLSITVGSKLAPGDAKAFWIYASATIIWSVWEFAYDSASAGKVMNVYPPIATFVGVAASAWFLSILKINKKIKKPEIYV